MTWSEGESCTGISASRFRPSHVERSSNLYEEVQVNSARGDTRDTKILTKS
jgi:hypothetical protein